MKGRRRNVIIAVVAVALVVLLGIFGAARRSPPALSVRTQTVRKATFSTTLPETGVVERPNTAVLPALVAGNLADISVRAGEPVKAGQVVATIVSPQLESDLATSQSAYVAASARANSAAQTNDALPAQNRSSVVQAEANLQAADVSLQQAREDLAAGQQSGLGYTGSTAEDQRVQADAAVAKADTDLHEAQRIDDANRDLYEQKAISRDTLDQSQARLQQAQVAADQAHREREILSGQLGRQHSVLVDRLHAAQDSQRQAQASLAAARANAAESHAGDVQAASADAARAASEMQFAQDQVGRLTVRAPFDGIVQSIASDPADALRPLQPGDALTPGQPLVTLATAGGFVVRTKVDEQDIASVRVGQRAKVSGEDLGSSTLPGHVAAIAEVAQKSDDPSNTARQVITTVALDRSLSYLRDGMSVDVDITTTRIPNVISVPSDAVHKDAGQAPYVYVVRGGKAYKTTVSLGATSDTATVVRSGLRSGDAVVVEKNDALADGAAVRAPASARPSPHA